VQQYHAGISYSAPAERPSRATLVANFNRSRLPWIPCVAMTHRLKKVDDFKADLPAFDVL
jgi:hypothetical protein